MDKGGNVTEEVLYLTVADQARLVEVVKELLGKDVGKESGGQNGNGDGDRNKTL